MKNKLLHSSTAVLFFAYSLSGVALAAEKVLTYPGLQGKPLLALYTTEIETELLRRGNLVCQMSGYSKVKVDKQGKMAAEFAYLLGNNQQYINLDSIEKNGHLNIGNSRYENRALSIRSFAEMRSNPLVTQRLNDSCSEVLSCGNVAPFDILATAIKLQNPYIKSCLGNEKVSVFKSITCVTDDNNQDEVAYVQRLNQFHQAQSNNLLAVETPSLEAALTIKDKSACEKYGLKQDLKSLGTIGSCNNNPYQETGPQGAKNLLVGGSPLSYGMITDRIKGFPKETSAELIQFTGKYLRMILKPEYNINSTPIIGTVPQATYCMNSSRIVADIDERDFLGCTIEVKTIDFMGQPNQLNIKYGIDYDSRTTSIEEARTLKEKKCTALLKKFQSAAISCKVMNPCSGPGTTDIRLGK